MASVLGGVGFEDAAGNFPRVAILHAVIALVTWGAWLAIDKCTRWGADGKGCATCDDCEKCGSKGMKEWMVIVYIMLFDLCYVVLLGAGMFALAMRRRSVWERNGHTAADISAVYAAAADNNLGSAAAEPRLLMAAAMQQSEQGKAPTKPMRRHLLARFEAQHGIPAGHVLLRLEQRGAEDQRRGAEDPPTSEEEEEASRANAVMLSNLEDVFEEWLSKRLRALEGCVESDHRGVVRATFHTVFSVNSVGKQDDDAETMTRNRRSERVAEVLAYYKDEANERYVAMYEDFAKKAVTFGLVMVAARTISEMFKMLFDYDAALASTVSKGYAERLLRCKNFIPASLSSLTCNSKIKRSGEFADVTARTLPHALGRIAVRRAILEMSVFFVMAFVTKRAVDGLRAFAEKSRRNEEPASMPSPAEPEDFHSGNKKEAPGAAQPEPEPEAAKPEPEAEAAKPEPAPAKPEPVKPAPAQAPEAAAPSATPSSSSSSSSYTTVSYTNGDPPEYKAAPKPAPLPAAPSATPSSSSSSSSYTTVSYGDPRTTYTNGNPPEYKPAPNEAPKPAPLPAAQPIVLPTFPPIAIKALSLFPPAKLAKLFGRKGG